MKTRIYLTSNLEVAEIFKLLLKLASFENC